MNQMKATYHKLKQNVLSTKQNYHQLVQCTIAGTYVLSSLVSALTRTAA